MSLYPDDSLTLHTDLYQINMMQTYWELGRHNRNSVFEVFFRSMPFENGYAIFAGLERMVNYLNNLRFTETDISYLRELDYPEDFWTTWRSFALQVQSVLSKKENSFLPMNLWFR